MLKGPIWDVPPLTESDPFTGTSGPRAARFAIIGEAYGAEEERAQRPFVGASGRLLRAHLRNVGISPDDCFWTNITNRRPPMNDLDRWLTGPNRVGGLRLSNELYEGLRALRAQLESLPNLKRILLVGNLALWALTPLSPIRAGRPGGIMQWRGSQLRIALPNGRTVEALPCIHPAAVLRQSEWQLFLQVDLQRFARADWEPPEEDFTIRPSLEEALHAIECASTSPLVAVDIEVRRGVISCIGFCWAPERAICIPFIDSGRHYWSPEDEKTVKRAIREFFKRQPKVVGQNFLFDAQYIAREFLIAPSCYLDTMVAHHLLLPGTPKDLSFLSSLYCRFHSHWKEEGKLWLEGAPEEVNWTYNCRDVARTREIAIAIECELKKTGLWRLYEEERRPTWHLCRDMMLRGIRFDSSQQEALREEVSGLIRELERYLQKAAPELSEWWRSPLKTRKLFYEQLGIRPVLSSKSGRETVGKEALPEIEKRTPDHLAPFVSAIIRRLREIRSAEVWRRTFLSAPADPDGRFRCFLNPVGTETFRFSSSENAWGRGGNMQNLPKEKEV